jgi:hypothetical protein
MSTARLKRLIVVLLTAPGLWYAGVPFEKRTVGSAAFTGHTDAQIRDPQGYHLQAVHHKEAAQHHADDQE